MNHLRLCSLIILLILCSSYSCSSDKASKGQPDFTGFTLRDMGGVDLMIPNDWIKRKSSDSILVAYLSNCAESKVFCENVAVRTAKLDKASINLDALLREFIATMPTRIDSFSIKTVNDTVINNIHMKIVSYTGQKKNFPVGSYMALAAYDTTVMQIGFASENIEQKYFKTYLPIFKKMLQSAKRSD